MTIIIILIAISLSIAILFLIIFCWNMRSGQYDDTYTPSVRILFDDKVHKSKPHSSDSSVKGIVKSKKDIRR
jgi:cbb3-type cytochrome oxidase maturation protein